LKWVVELTSYAVYNYTNVKYFNFLTLKYVFLNYSWPLYVFYICNVGSGLGGYFVAIMTQGNAYISDITPPEKRGKR